MQLQRLEVSNFRNLKDIKIEPGSGFNLIYGANASGKSSLLEAVYFLGMGKSFRISKPAALIQNGSSQFSIFAQFRSSLGRITKAGAHRDHQVMTIKVDGEYINRASSLASMFPMQIIEPNLYQFLNEGPEFRRRYIDWGVFHVEQGFEKRRKEFYRYLNQRNAALKQHLPDRQIQQWDSGLTLAGNQIDQMRKAFIEKASCRVHSGQTIPKLLGDCTFDYYQGWPREISYKECLCENLASDKERGYTQLGPHRADLRVKSGKQPAKDVLSRGQQKILISSFLIAQCQIVKEDLGKDVILLIDDLSSEMDQDNQKLLLDMVKETRCQAFITTLKPDDLSSAFSEVPFRMFHVEHGCVSRVV